MQAAQPVLKNTGGRKDPTPRVQSRFALPVSGRSADFFPGVLGVW